MGSEVTNDEKKKGKITDAISKWIPLLTGIITLIVAVGNAILNYFNYDYARKAEEFYEIPSRYFTNSFVDDKVMIFVYIVAYFMILGSPLIIKKLCKINRFDVFTSVFYSLCITLFVGITVMLSTIKIIDAFNLQVSGIVVLIATGVIAIITCGLYVYLFTKDFSNVRKEDLEKQDNIIKRLSTKFVSFIKELPAKFVSYVKELPAKFISFIRELPALIFAMVLTIVFIAPFIITDARITENPKNKTKYELVIINDGDKGNKRDMAVVSYKNGKAVLMDCTIIPQVTMNGKEIENLLLTKGKYRLIDIEGNQIEYREFNLNYSQLCRESG